MTLTTDTFDLVRKASMQWWRLTLNYSELRNETNL